MGADLKNSLHSFIFKINFFDLLKIKKKKNKFVTVKDCLEFHWHIWSRYKDQSRKQPVCREIPVAFSRV